MADRKPVWFITGCSTGFGRELAKHLLDAGYPTVVTARNTDDLADLVAGRDNALALQLDVTLAHEVASTVKEAENHFGRIDVLVNNAGIGYFGSVEESEEAEYRRMFEINLFGLAAMTRAVLPVMRTQRSGAIVNVSSIGGLRGSPGVAFYNATKFAVEGLSEGLNAEVSPLGIKVVVVEPGPFRTDWAGRSANESPASIADYAGTAHKNAGTIRGYSGNQPGDPVRAAQAIVQAVESADPPFRLLLGKVALQAARAKVDVLRAQVEACAQVAEGADFPV